MTTRLSRRARRILGVVAALAALMLLAACKNVGEQDFLNPSGPIARRQHNLFVPVFWIATAIFVIVEGMIVYAIFRFREKRGGPAPVQVHGNTKLEIGWTLAPAVLLAAISVPTVAMIFSLAEEPKGPDVVRIKVTGHQWWWEYEYETDPPVATANEMVIPTDRPVFLTITSDDVIHSFWVPKLAGKQDAIPHRTNTMTLEADTPGTYYGQCAEFCALSHANMKLRVVAKEPAEYERWLAGQKQAAQVPPSGQIAEGARAFREFKGGTCMSCHAIRGLEGAEGQVGPDLTHFASRASFAGSMLELTQENLHAWLDDPPALKPGSLMPDYDIPPATINALVAFLLSLK